MSDFYQKSIESVLRELNVDKRTGLSSAEVLRRQKIYGKNNLRIRSTPLWRRLIEPFLDIFMIILIIALVLSIIQGTIAEIMMISFDIIIDALIYYYQDFSTERILRNLRKEIAQPVRTLRDGHITEVDASDLVPGDIVLLSEGERIPADGRLIEESGIQITESILTGESNSVMKDTHIISGTKPIYERTNSVFAGSFMLTGSGRFVVTATSNETEYGRIASLATTTPSISPIQAKINKLVVRIAIFILILSAVIMGIQLIEGISFASAAQFTLALIVSATPEDLPIATAIILALGARRMAKKRALVRELRAIESIGVVTTICSDKTGTLTENRLSVTEVWSDRAIALGDELIRSAISLDDSSDPMDACLWEYAKSERLANLRKPDHYFAFNQSLRMSGNLYFKNQKSLIYLKGSPEAILKHCHLSTRRESIISLKISEFADFGYKVLAVGKCTLDTPISDLSELPPDARLDFVGLIAVADTIRKEARSAIYDVKHSGVSVKMITGDHAGTAYTIGKKLGLVRSRRDVLDCTNLEHMDETTLIEKAKSATIFARVSPTDKYRIVSALKRSEVIAMTGDGINDIPAIRTANVGIAMGDSPSIVEDTADIILTDNNFTSIASAVRIGRIILLNIRRMLIYLLSSNLSEVLVGLIGLIFGHTQLLLPIQILWVNLVTDNLLIIPIGLEPAEKGILDRPPQSISDPLLSRQMITRIIITALSDTLVVSITYFIAHELYSYEIANTLAFTALVVTQWSGAFAIRGLEESSFRRLRIHNPLFFVGLVLAITMQLIANFGPLMGFVGTETISPLVFLIVAVPSFLIPLLFIEIHKLSCKKYNKK